MASPKVDLDSIAQKVQESMRKHVPNVVVFCKANSRVFGGGILATARIEDDLLTAESVVQPQKQTEDQIAEFLAMDLLKILALQTANTKTANRWLEDLEYEEQATDGLLEDDDLEEDEDDTLD